MSLEIHLGFKHHKLLLQAFPILAEEMVSPEVLLERIVVQVVMWLSRISPVTDKAPLMLIPAVLVQLVAIVETRAAESAKRVPPKPCLIDCTRLVVAVPHVFGQLLVGKHVVFVGKDLLVPSAQIAHLLAVDGADMSMQIRPTEAGKVALRVRAIVPEQKDRVAYNILPCVLDTNILISAGNICVCIVLETLFCIISEDDEGRRCLGRI
jgi:hypothetical protein